MKGNNKDYVLRFHIGKPFSEASGWRSGVHIIGFPTVFRFAASVTSGE